MSSEVFEDFGPISEVKSFGDYYGFFGVCVPAVRPSVLVVTVFLWNVNVVGEAVFFF